MGIPVTRSLTVIFPIAGVASGEPLRAEGFVEACRRVVPLETITGVAATGERVEIQIDVPDDCDGEPAAPTAYTPTRGT